jgi:hypothetical protein
VGQACMADVAGRAMQSWGDRTTTLGRLSPLATQA